MSDARGILLARRAGQATLLMLFLTIVSTILSLSTRAAEREFGGFGPEGPRMREQLWILPSGEAGRDMRATVFRPNAADMAPPADVFRNRSEHASTPTIMLREWWRPMTLPQPSIT